MVSAPPLPVTHPAEGPASVLDDEKNSEEPIREPVSLCSPQPTSSQPANNQPASLQSIWLGFLSLQPAWPVLSWLASSLLGKVLPGHFHRVSWRPQRKTWLLTLLATSAGQCPRDCSAQWPRDSTAQLHRACQRPGRHQLLVPCWWPG